MGGWGRHSAGPADFTYWAREPRCHGDPKVLFKKITSWEENGVVINALVEVVQI